MSKSAGCISVRAGQNFSDCGGAVKSADLWEIARSFGDDLGGGVGLNLYIISSTLAPTQDDPNPSTPLRHLSTSGIGASKSPPSSLLSYYIGDNRG